MAELTIDQKRAIAMASARLRLKQGAQQTPAAEPDAIDSPVNATVRMLATPLLKMAGIKRGIEDPVDAGAQMLVNALPEKVVQGANKALGPGLAPTASQFNQSQADEEAAYQKERATMGESGFDGARLIGNVAGTAPVLSALPMGASTLIGTSARGAQTGAIMGALNPVSNPNESFWGQKGQQTALGAGSGAVFSPAISALARAIAPKVDAGVKYLLDKGIRLRPDQMMGRTASTVADKAQSLPVVGDAISASQRRAVEDFNRAAYNEVLKPLGTKYAATDPVGREGVEVVQRTVGQAYDDILPKIQFKADGTFVSEFKNLARMAQSLPPDKYTQFQKVMENELLPRFSKTGQMDGLTFKAMETELNNFARNYSSSSSADDRAVASAVREVLTSARGALERSNPTLAPQLRKINQAFATFTRVQDAASRIGGEEGVFTPHHLLSAVRSGDKSARKGAFARGDALLQKLAETGKTVMGGKYPDSGTAGRTLQAGLALGGGYMIDPSIAAGALAASSLYTRPGQALAQTLLTRRPAGAAPIRALLEPAAVPGGALLGAGLGRGLLF